MKKFWEKKEDSVVVTDIQAVEPDTDEETENSEEEEVTDVKKPNWKKIGLIGTAIAGGVVLLGSIARTFIEDKSYENYLDSEEDEVEETDEETESEDKEEPEED